jgi:hypothetical protein
LFAGLYGRTANVIGRPEAIASLDQDVARRPGRVVRAAQHRPGADKREAHPHRSPPLFFFFSHIGGERQN